MGMPIDRRCLPLLGSTLYTSCTTLCEPEFHDVELFHLKKGNTCHVRD